MGVDPNVERMEIQDWLLRIKDEKTEFPFWRKLLYKIQRRRTTRYKFVYTKVFSHGILHDYSYWLDFIKHNISVPDGRASIDVATDAMYIGRRYVKIETLTIANERGRMM